MTGVDHVLLTRFNLPTQGVEGLIRARDGWLHNRVKLFERYCAPSVAGQTRPVRWIIYLDPETPRWLRDRLAPYVQRGLFRPVFRAAVSQQDLLADIAEHVPRTADALVTSNLDNDDGLALDFSERITSLTTRDPRVVIYLSRGLIRTADDLFVRIDRRNAFCSVREPWESAVTAWSEYHNEFPRVMPALEVGGPPGWLQVVHDANVSNRVRGRLIDPRHHRDRFGDLLDDLPSPTNAEIVQDTLLRFPVRTLRDGGRSAVRATGLRLLGKDRYQRAKLRLSALGRPRLVSAQPLDQPDRSGP